MPQQHESVDAVVIGAGVIGASIGHELARRGWRTCNVDALAEAGSGSTSSSSAIVRFTYSTRAGVAMAWEGMHHWANWADHLGADDERGLARFVRCGTVVLCEPGGHHDRFLPIFDDVGIPYERWDLDQLVARWPGIETGVLGPPRPIDDERSWADPTRPLEGAVFTPDAGYVSDPQLAAHNLQRATEARGGSFRFGARVVEVVRADDRVAGVVLDDGTTVTAPVVVNAAGPHSGRVNALAGLDGTMAIGTRPMRHEVHQVPAPSSLDWARTGAHVADDDAGVYLRPQAGGTEILVGSTDPACDDREWVDDPDDFDRSPSHAQWERQLIRLGRRVPDLGVPNQPRGLADLYDVSDDWIPVYDRTDLDGFYVAIGTSGNQFKNAGIVGHCMAELVTAVEAGHDHDADPLVVPGPRTGLDLDLATFARNRAVNPDSSMSVNG